MSTKEKTGLSVYFGCFVHVFNSCNIEMNLQQKQRKSIRRKYVLVSNQNTNLLITQRFSVTQYSDVHQISYKLQLINIFWNYWKNELNAIRNS